MTHRFWTTAEVSKLKALLKSRAPRSVICKKLSRTPSSVRSQITRSGFQVRRQSTWTDADDAAMIEAIRAGHSIRRIASNMDRSPSSIKGRMNGLGIKLCTPETFGGQVPKVQRHFLKDYAKVMALVAKGMDNSAISRESGICRATVRRWRSL